jgi:hypothetical protein
MKGLNKICWGGKWEGVKGNLLLLLSLASEHGDFLLLLPLATKWGSSFLFFKKVKSDHLGFLFSEHYFQLKS